MIDCLMKVSPLPIRHTGLDFISIDFSTKISLLPELLVSPVGTTFW